MKGEFEAVRHAWQGESLVQKLERYVDRETRGVLWEHHMEFAEELRELYVSNFSHSFNSISNTMQLRIEHGRDHGYTPCTSWQASHRARGL
jgi:hypothetical protein